MTNRERKLTFRSLICVAGGLLALSAIAIGLAIWALRIDAADDASRDATNMATVLAEQTGRMVQSVEIVLTDLNERMIAMGVTTPDSFRGLTDSKEMFNLLQE